MYFLYILLYEEVKKKIDISNLFLKFMNKIKELIIMFIICFCFFCS